MSRFRWWLRVLGCVVLILGCGVLANRLRLGISTTPVVAVRTMVDLGSLEQSTTHGFVIPIRNDGREMLILDSFQVDCPTCYHLTKRTDAGVEPLDRLEIPAGQTREVVARVFISGSAGGIYQGFIRCRTNDLDHPDLTLKIRARIIGRIESIPDRIRFDPIVLGESGVNHFQLADTLPNSTRRVREIRCEPSDRLVVESASLSGATRPLETSGTDLGSFALHLKSTTISGDREGRLLVFCEGDTAPKLTIPVTWTDSPRLVSHPSTIILPRYGGGKPLLKSKWVCRSPLLKPIHLQDVNAAPGLRVRPLTSDSDAELHVEVEWVEGINPGSERTATFRIDVDGVPEVVRLPIRYLPREPSVP